MVVRPLLVVQPPVLVLVLHRSVLVLGLLVLQPPVLRSLVLGSLLHALALRLLVLVLRRLVHLLVVHLLMLVLHLLVQVLHLLALPFLETLHPQALQLLALHPLEVLLLKALLPPSILPLKGEEVEERRMKELSSGLPSLLRSPSLLSSLPHQNEPKHVFSKSNSSAHSPDVNDTNKRHKFDNRQHLIPHKHRTFPLQSWVPLFEKEKLIEVE
mmetsp:Transcript_33252/g.45555  ORF Transcript_33252/g.45555 Transcript_33252/m.45555 type:complete len:213 (-) Transcript_33252:509-1147(-)